MGHIVVAHFSMFIFFVVAVVWQRSDAITGHPINESKKIFIVVGVGLKHRMPKDSGDSGEMALQQEIAVGGRSRGRSKRKFARIVVENAVGAMATRV